MYASKDGKQGTSSVENLNRTGDVSWIAVGNDFLRAFRRRYRRKCIRPFVASWVVFFKLARITKSCPSVYSQKTSLEKPDVLSDTPVTTPPPHRLLIMKIELVLYSCDNLILVFRHISMHNCVIVVVQSEYKAG